MKPNNMNCKKAMIVIGAIALGTVGFMGRFDPSKPTYAQIPAPQETDRSPFSESWMTLNSNLDSVENSQGIIAANTRFGLKLFSQIYQQEKEENIFISPFSLTLALQMLNGGANGETQEIITTVLETQGIDPEQIDRTLGTLQTQLYSSDPGVELAIANSFWMKEGGSFNSQFIQRNQDHYQAAIQEINFNDPEGVSQTINTWVAEQTQQKIDHILEFSDFNSATVALLVNAIYFKSGWLSPFLESATQDYPFNLTNGQTIPYPVMFQTQEFSYYENALFQAVALPYGNSAEVNLYLFLPRLNVGLDTFLEGLNPETWNLWLKEYWEAKPVKLGLPKFTLEYSIELKNILTAMNMGIAFSPESDFSGMTSEPFWISQIKHKTFLEVNEQGTEASAVTGVMSTRSAPVEMILDRPFFFAIQDEATGTLLFIGTLVNPTL